MTPDPYASVVVPLVVAVNPRVTTETTSSAYPYRGTQRSLVPPPAADRRLLKEAIARLRWTRNRLSSWGSRGVGVAIDLCQCHDGEQNYGHHEILLNAG